MARRFLAFIAAALLLAGPAVAADRGMEGTWAFKSEGHIVMVLRLKGTSGTLERPQHANFAGGAAVSGIQLPVTTAPLEVAAAGPGALRIREPDPAHPGRADILDFRQIGPDIAELTIEGAPISPIPFVRVGADARVDPNIARRAPDVPDNPAMSRIYDADQLARRGDVRSIDFDAMTTSDAKRRAQVQEMIRRGELHSATDFLHAAFIFQHGDTPADFLFAHTLAVIALRKGSDQGAWIAAATLDRYLQKIGQPQVFGTQFLWGPGKPYTQDPYDRTLIPDSLRALLGVPNQAAQDLQLKAYQAPAKAP